MGQTAVYCFKCEYLKICTGECPKNRFLTTPEGQPGLNYLCAGFKFFYAHVAPYMKFMANEIRNDRAPSNVIDWIKRKQAQVKPVVREPAKILVPKKMIVHLNDPCPCGSGMPYKKCCALKPRSQQGI